VNSLLRYRLDPVALFEDVGNDAAGAAYPWQVDALRSRSQRQLYLCTRGGGKSSVAATKGLWTAMFIPRSFVLFLSRSQDQSQEIFRKCSRAYKDLGYPFGLVASSTQKMELGNGSRIHSISSQEDAGRAWTSHLLVIDEAAMVKTDAIEGALGTVRGGAIIALTTPKGPRGWFYRMWNHPQIEQVYERYLVTVDGIPNPDLKARAEEELILQGPRFVRREYHCEWGQDDDAFFDPAVLEASLVVPEGDVWFPERSFAS
jgi:hypothetical protein